MVLRTTAGMSTQADVVISPATSTSPVVVAVSHATRAIGSCARMASSTPSEIWSQSLSGCPSVTDSLVKNTFGFFMKLLKIDLLFQKKLHRLYVTNLGARLPRTKVLLLLRSQR